MCNYQRTLDYLFNRLPMYQQKGLSAYKSDIKRITYASREMSNPHSKFKKIHIAGTNGKGSTAHMLASVLQESGYKTGIYSSPHLKDFRERIKINGELIDKDYIIKFVNDNKVLFENYDLSFFEMTVLLAFNFFNDKKVDIAIVEAGLGGRLDSTNIITPILSIITNIGFDHTDILGDSLIEIANEKAGIIKKNIPVIVGDQKKEIANVFLDKAKKMNAQLNFVNHNNNYPSDLGGNYQKLNASTAIEAINVLNDMKWNISTENIKKGLSKVIKNTSFLGRWQIVSKEPLIIYDIAHNEDALIKVIKNISEISFSELHIVFGMSREKKIKNILSCLPKKATYYFCQANIERSLDVMDLYLNAKKLELNGSVFKNTNTALCQAKKNANKNDLILVTGSAFIVSEVV